MTTQPMSRRQRREAERAAAAAQFRTGAQAESKPPEPRPGTPSALPARPAALDQGPSRPDGAAGPAGHRPTSRRSAEPHDHRLTEAEAASVLLGGAAPVPPALPPVQRRGRHSAASTPAPTAQSTGNGRPTAAGPAAPAGWGAPTGPSPSADPPASSAAPMTRMARRRMSERAAPDGPTTAGLQSPEGPAAAEAAVTRRSRRLQQVGSAAAAERQSPASPHPTPGPAATASVEAPGRGHSRAAPSPQPPRARAASGPRATAPGASPLAATPARPSGPVAMPAPHAVASTGSSSRHGSSESATDALRAGRARILGAGAPAGAAAAGTAAAPAGRMGAGQVRQAQEPAPAAPASPAPGASIHGAPVPGAAVPPASPALPEATAEESWDAGRATGPALRWKPIAGATAAPRVHGSDPVGESAAGAGDHAGDAMPEAGGSAAMAAPREPERGAGGSAAAPSSPADVAAGAAQAASTGGRELRFSRELEEFRSADTLQVPEIRRMRRKARNQDRDGADTPRVGSSQTAGGGSGPARGSRRPTPARPSPGRRSASVLGRTAVLATLAVATVVAPVSGQLTNAALASTGGFSQSLNEAAPQAGSRPSSVAAAVLGSDADLDEEGGEDLSNVPDAATLARIREAYQNAAKTCSSVTGASGDTSAFNSAPELFYPMLPDTYTISSEYGYRIHPTLGYLKLHAGQDLSAPVGTAIYAVAAGTVTTAGMVDGTGTVTIKHEVDGKVWYTSYLHMYEDGIYVKAGDTVTAGQLIAGVGNTGRSSGPHLHFEVRTADDTADESTVEPWGWLKEHSAVELTTNCS
ncbi:M23 family metallopeptidase [Actinomyces bowdenii]|nr:M23 family metallopeptidase [Actinomyces bowdenii]